MLTVDPRDTNDLLSAFGDHLLDALASMSALTYLAANLSQREASLPETNRLLLAKLADACLAVEQAGGEVCEDEELAGAITASDATPPT